MKLRYQLAALSLTFLAIPWAGCEFLKSNEKTLSILQEQSLKATGQAIAHGLYNDSRLLYPEPIRVLAPFTDRSLQVHRLKSALILDGYFGDWPEVQWRRFGTERRPLDLRLGKHGAQLVVAVKVADDSKSYDTTTPGTEPSGDRLVLVTWLGNQRQRYVISTAAPGKVVARLLGRQLASAQPNAITGHWADTSAGYQLELTLPFALAGERLGVYYLDADEGGISVRGNVAPLDTEAPPWLVHSTAGIEQWINRYQNQGIGVQILDRWGWPLATALETQRPTQARTFWLTPWLYRQILGTPPPSLASQIAATGQMVSLGIATAQRGLETQETVATPEGIKTRFTAPIKSSQGLIGIVVTESTRNQYLSVSTPAFEALLVGGTGALILCYVTVLIFAIVLGKRISGLSRATQNLGVSDTTLPLDGFNDELTQLTRAFNNQLHQQQQLQAYLKALPQSLAHEIRTPLAIIRSAIALLTDGEPSLTEQQQIMARAESGVDRLTQLLNTMNEANQLEQIMEHEPLKTTDLSALVEELAAAYNLTFIKWTFAVLADETAVVAKISPDLIVQALDKLIANATSFARPGTTIALKLSQRGLWWRLTVINLGPPLPSDTDRLFAPMVSLRDKDQKTEGSLGLGLYIVSLVARHHNGEPWAHNLEDGTGVEVGFSGLLG
ncbi:MAG: histidine kinase dimerization/phospho-acceptor domain-containing protein [Luminiphilus sp.]|nr:histidine kinase dimerization/phospho-acceptor domain-containing protein [Luminiphilus sp.]